MALETPDNFCSFFKQATGREQYPYPYQTRLAFAENLRGLLNIPTGLGKSAAAILSWLWRRNFHPDCSIRTSTPRRIIYCLPMRVLVEQTFDNASTWLKNLAMEDKVGLHALMGGEKGEKAEDWDLYPERDAILVGTQDMLLSRALNRGYGMSRYRWPMHFGLLHTDCLWVFDEIQLMGSGLATTAQLEAFRTAVEKNDSQCLWMSATLQRDWLHTVDFDPTPLTLIKLEDDDLATKEVNQILEAPKPLRRAGARMGDASALAKEIVAAHKGRGGRTLAIVNTVARARELHISVQRQLKVAGIPLDPILIHSRFRPAERTEQVKRLLAEPGDDGMIVISTQVVEAGVDASARTLFTELAPWSSLVQRFGRCNRRGLPDDHTAQVFWIDSPEDATKQERVSKPYELSNLVRSRDLLRDLLDVGPASLARVPFTEQFRHGHVIRQKDFIELFDTTPDLAGNDIDIERYVREIDDCDVQVFWREWSAEEMPSVDMEGPRREELCSVQVGEFREFIKSNKRRNLAFRWDYLDRQWARIGPDRIYPGQIYLLHANAGGYALESGWNLKSIKPVVVVAPAMSPPLEANDADPLSELAWQSIAEHTDNVCRELDAMLKILPLPESPVLRLAARWHDQGKTHEVFQKAVRAKLANGQTRPAKWLGRSDIAKAPKGWWDKYERKRFRHELASTLAALVSLNSDVSEETRDLVAYLVAAHHGKVRLSIRSLPEENTPPDHRRFARGVWDGDNLPATDLGGGVSVPAVTLSLEPMELGLCEQPPFAGQPSWAERMLALRDKLSLFRLAYLEAILRAADMRGSMQEPSHV